MSRPAACCVVAALTLGCGGRAAPAGLRISATAPAPVQDEFDPLGFVVEHRSELDLSDAQVSAVLALRGKLRSANRADRTALDSLDFALGGRLGNWIAEAQGGARSRRRWLPKMAPDQRETFERLVGAIHTRRGRGVRDGRGALVGSAGQARAARRSRASHDAESPNDR